MRDLNVSSSILTQLEHLGVPADRAWPDPDFAVLGDAVPPAPTWPAGVLSPAWAAWCEAAAAEAGAPIDYVAGALLAVASGLVGNARWASPWAGWEEPAALFVGLVGGPSSGKSPALKRVSRLVARLERDANQGLAERQREVREARESNEARKEAWKDEARAAARAGRSPPAPPAAGQEESVRPQRLFVIEASPERAASMSCHNPRGLLLIRDELSGWLGGMDKYRAGGRGGERAFWLSAFGGHAYRRDLVKDGDESLGTMVEYLTWSVVGTIQPDRLASLLLTGDDDGLCSRFLFVWPEARPPARPAGRRADDDWAASALSRLRGLAWEPPAPMVLSMSRAAGDVVQDLRVRLAAATTATTGLMASALGKGPGVVVRLALLLDLLAWASQPSLPLPERITDLAVSSAIGLYEQYLVPMAARVFGGTSRPEEEKDASVLARWILAQPNLPTVLNPRTLRSRAGRPAIGSAARLSGAFEVLAAHAWCRSAPGRAGAGTGRLRNDWEINPLLARARPS